MEEDGGPQDSMKCGARKGSITWKRVGNAQPIKADHLGVKPMKSQEQAPQVIHRH